MDWRIATHLIDAIVADAARDPHAERCGLLVGSAGEVRGMHPAANVAGDPAAAFEVDPTALLAAHREARGEGLAVVGVWHSHPSGLAEPSDCDRARALDAGWLWLIVGARGTVAGWHAEAPHRFAPARLLVAAEA